MASPLVRIAGDGTILADDGGKVSVQLGNYLQALRTSVPSQIASHGTLVSPGDAELTATEEYDLISVNLVAGQTYSFSYRGTPGGIEDPYLAIFGPGGAYITEDDDGGFGRTSMITITASQSGTYTLYATSWYSVAGYPVGTDTGGYTINMWTVEAGHDAGDDMANATSLTTGTTSSGFET